MLNRFSVIGAFLISAVLFMAIPSLSVKATEGQDEWNFTNDGITNEAKEKWDLRYTEPFINSPFSKDAPFEVMTDLLDPHDPTSTIHALFINPKGLPAGTTANPRIESPQISLQAADYSVIYVRMKSNANRAGVVAVGRFFFKTAPNPLDIFFDAQHKVPFKIVSDGNWHDYFIYVGNHSNWQRTITQIRIDLPVSASAPIGGGETGTDDDFVAFDFVKILKRDDPLVKDKSKNHSAFLNIKINDQDITQNRSVNVQSADPLKIYFKLKNTGTQDWTDVNEYYLGWIAVEGNGGFEAFPNSAVFRKWYITSPEPRSVDAGISACKTGISQISNEANACAQGEGDPWETTLQLKSQEVIKAPDQQGTYTIKFAMVEEGKDQFEEVATINVVVSRLPVPALCVTPSSHTFENTPVNSSSDFEFSLTNCGTGTVTGGKASIADEGFHILSGESFSLAENDLPQKVIVRFAPTSNKTFSGTVQFTSSNADAKIAKVVGSTGTVSKPTADFSFLPTQPHAYETIQFTDKSRTSSGATITEWQWDFGDKVGHSTEQNPKYTYSTPSRYTVTLTVTDSNGQSASKERVIVVAAPISDALKSEKNALIDDLANLDFSFLEISGIDFSQFHVPTWLDYDEPNARIFLKKLTPSSGIVANESLRRLILVEDLTKTLYFGDRDGHQWGVAVIADGTTKIVASSIGFLLSAQKDGEFVAIAVSQIPFVGEAAAEVLRFALDKLTIGVLDLLSQTGKLLGNPAGQYVSAFFEGVKTGYKLATKPQDFFEDQGLQLAIRYFGDQALLGSYVKFFTEKNIDDAAKRAIPCVDNPIEANPACPKISDAGGADDALNKAKSTAEQKMRSTKNIIDTADKVSEIAQAVISVSRVAHLFPPVAAPALVAEGVAALVFIGASVTGPGFGLTTMFLDMPTLANDSINRIYPRPSISSSGSISTLASVDYLAGQSRRLPNLNSPNAQQLITAAENSAEAYKQNLDTLAHAVGAGNRNTIISASIDLMESDKALVSQTKQQLAMIGAAASKALGSVVDLPDNYFATLASAQEAEGRQAFVLSRVVPIITQNEAEVPATLPSLPTAISDAKQATDRALDHIQNLLQILSPFLNIPVVSTRSVISPRRVGRLQEFQVVAEFINLGAIPATDVAATLEVGSKISLRSPATQSLGTLQPGSTKTITWLVQSMDTSGSEFMTVRTSVPSLPDDLFSVSIEIIDALFFDDMEVPNLNWKARGNWHVIDQRECATRLSYDLGLSSPIHAWYY